MGPGAACAASARDIETDVNSYCAAIIYSVCVVRIDGCRSRRELSAYRRARVLDCLQPREILLKRARGAASVRGMAKVSNDTP